MAHFAQIDNEGNVLRVIVVANEKLLVDGVESEEKGIEFCKRLCGQDTNWVQTSYNGNKRTRFAGIGYKYDSNYNAFIPPPQKKVTEEEKITFDEEKLLWVSDRIIESPKKL